jgi:hypothetical protein
MSRNIRERTKGMRRRSEVRLVCVAVAAVLFSQVCSAQGGAVPVRIWNDPASSRCINGNSDVVWVTLRRVITDKSKGWLKEDKSIAVMINASVKTQQSDKPISFPLMAEETLRGFSNGQVSIPIEYTIVNGLRLKQGQTTYSGISLEMTLLNKQGRTKWGNALQALGEVAKKLPVPSNPYSQGASYLLDFANSAVTKDIDAQNNDDKTKSAALALNFDPTGSCNVGGPSGSDFERTGTIAVIQESGTQGDGYVPVNQTNEYCWSAELTPAFVLKAAHKDGSKPCNSADYKYRQVTNNYVGFFVNAITSTGKLGGASADRKDAIKRCEAHGLAAERCLPPVR